MTEKPKKDDAWFWNLCTILGFGVIAWTFFAIIGFGANFGWHVFLFIVSKIT